MNTNNGTIQTDVYQLTLIFYEITFKYINLYNDHFKMHFHPSCGKRKLYKISFLKNSSQSLNEYSYSGKNCPKCNSCVQVNIF